MFGRKSIDKQSQTGPVFGYWEALYLSFYSKYLYLDVAKHWRGVGLMYLLFVYALLSIPYAIKTSILYQESINQQLIKAIILLPPLTVKEGKVVVDKPMPYLIKNDKKQVVVVIDTHGDTAQFNPKYPYQSILITEHQLAFKVPLFNFFKGEAYLPRDSTTLSQNLRGFDGQFNGKEYIAGGNMKVLLWTLPIMTYCLLVLALFFCTAGLYLLMALLAQFYALVFLKMRLSYRKSCLLLIVSSTPMLCLACIFLFFRTLFPGQGILMLFLMTVYYSFALFVFKRDSRQLVSR